MIDQIPILSREQWLELRRGDITASDIAAICGASPYRSAARVWAEKRGLVPPQEMTDAMRRGLWGEAAVFEALMHEHPDWTIRRAKVYLRDTEAGIGATPDGVAMVPGIDGVVIIQAKVVAAPVFMRDWAHGDGSVDDVDARAPLHYQLQTLTEMRLADASRGVLAVLVTDTYQWVLREFWVDRHAEAEDAIWRRAREFRQTYLSSDEPPPFQPRLDGDLLPAIYPIDDGTTVDLTGDNALPHLVAERDEIKARMKADKERLDEIEAEIRAKLGSHTYATLADGRMIAHKTQHRKSYVVPETTFRVLRIIAGGKDAKEAADDAPGRARKKSAR
jgi:putative phage-type endonuclease